MSSNSILITFSFFNLSPVVISSDNFASVLYSSLFKGNYTPDIHPYCSKKAVNVTIDVGLREIVDLSEKHETIKLKIWVRLQWKDCNFVWNVSEFGGISQIGVPYEKLWIPDVTLFEGINDVANMPDMKQYRALITNIGQIQYQFPTAIQMTCGMNISMFPYDYQMCTLTFGSWIHSNSEIEMFSKSDTGDLTSFVNHQEWVVVSLKATKMTELYTCCEEPFSSISYKLVIKRKATFYIITMILPFFALTVLSIAGFVLPSISGEKMSFHMNILLAMTVYLLLIQDSLPSSSEFFPKIGIYFINTLLIICLSCVLSVIVVYLFYHDLSGKQMPKWVKRVLVVGLGRLMFITEDTVIRFRAQQTSGKEPAEKNLVIMKTPKAKKSRKIVKPTALSGIQNAVYDGWETEVGEVRRRDPNSIGFTEIDNSNKKMNEWELLAYILDRFFTILYTLVVSLNTVAFLIVFGQNDAPS
ncbi:neuronal acetylcholine receptor subunit alpha-10-like [Saccostrea echinata]|uniref:neuronal acetylcholine receptor subunit alpha-10-like n=1 Tax=Saccostrea echinata TaxID=191078 RepID=UPI002A817A7C|nr:neuronal acetylcholine receptor subunit alpha-10-like [Saccostrea echinata]